MIFLFHNLIHSKMHINESNLFYLKNGKYSELMKNFYSILIYLNLRCIGRELSNSLKILFKIMIDK